MKQVVCVNNNVVGKHLTVGKTYKILKSEILNNHTIFLLINDMGNTYWYSGERFVAQQTPTNIPNNPVANAILDYYGKLSKDNEKFKSPKFGTNLEVECQHEMKEYLGFTESYRYCIKCDHKERIV